MNRVTARRRVIAVSTTALFAAVTATAAVAGETYTVKVTRPVKVDQEFTVTSHVEVKQTVTAKANGQKQPAHTEKHKGDLTGTEKVEAVNDKTGGATKVSVTVGKLTVDGKELYPAGTVITADHTGEKVAFTVDGADVPEDKAALLDDLIDVERASRTASDDEVFADDKPQEVGATWDADTAKLVDMLAGDDITVTAEHVKGSSKLTAVKPVDGTPSEVVESTITADSLEPGKDLGNGMTLTDGTFTGTVTQTLPTDPAGLSATADAVISTTLKANDGTGAVSVEMKIDRKIHSTVTPKK